MTVGEGTPEAPSSIQGLVKGSLGAVTKSLAHWRQGDLIELGLEEGSVDAKSKPALLPLTWLMPIGLDSVTELTNSAASVRPFYNRFVRSPFVIASQTCDIVDPKTAAKQPLILAAPLVSSAGLGDLASVASKGRVDYLVQSKYIDPRNASLTWYADLRILVPLSKGNLLHQKPNHEAFDTNGLMKFATNLAHKFARPAIADILVDDLPRVIDSHVNNSGPSSDVFVQTEEVRLHVTGGSLMNVTQARIIVIVEPEVLKTAKSAWIGWEPGIRPKLKNQGIKLGPTLVITAKELSSDIYRQTSALRISSLGPCLWK